MSKTGNGLCILKSCLCCSAFEGCHTTKTSKGAHKTLPKCSLSDFLPQRNISKLLSEPES